ncbi:MAG TPA: Mur ligase domain-containing protein [Candidatus Saccharimonadales bacterium]|nr:Mur ligase domain-containing protein [Candidatus Saccharimonadales bacterium]
MMHIYFIGIGGTAIGPLALIAKQAGYAVSGSDKQGSAYIEYLKSQGIDDIYIGSDENHISGLHKKTPIDMIVYSSAVSIENPDHPQILFGKANGIKTAKRDELLNKIIQENNLKLIAVAGTHGKTTTTAMLVWLFKQMDIPCSYSVGAKISYGDMGHFDKSSGYFIYECDEFDRNFLAFHPHISVITGIDYDHQEQYPSLQSYQEAFRQFLRQSKTKIVWQKDIDESHLESDDSYVILEENSGLLNTLSLPGNVNRRDALQTITAVGQVSEKSEETMVKAMNDFPGVSRRFEKIADNLYSDYAHTIPKIKGCLQLADEVTDAAVIIYEPLTNRRQYYIRDEYKNLFKGVKKLYWVPSYLAREDPSQKVITPQEFVDSIDEPADKQPAALDDNLRDAIKKHLEAGDTVVCLSGGGGGSLDEWLRKNFKPQ